MTLNKWMDTALAGMGMPRAEEPMRDQTGMYITWRLREDRKLYASGALYARSYLMDVYIWLGDVGEPEAYQTAACELLTRAGCRAVKRQGASWVASVERRCAPITCIVPGELVEA